MGNIFKDQLLITSVYDRTQKFLDNPTDVLIRSFSKVLKLVSSKYANLLFFIHFSFIFYLNLNFTYLISRFLYTFIFRFS